MTIIAAPTQAPPRRRRPLRATLWIVLCVAALWLWMHYGGKVRLASPATARAAAEIRLTDLSGRAFDLAELRGKVVLLNLWAGWCGPCRAEIPRLNRLEADLGPAGLVVLGVNAESLGSAVLESTAARLGIDYTVARPDGPLQGTLRPAGPIPQTWWIDREGRVRASRVGLVSERAMRLACETLLREGGG